MNLQALGFFGLRNLSCVFSLREVFHGLELSALAEVAFVVAFESSTLFSSRRSLRNKEFFLFTMFELRFLFEGKVFPERVCL